MTVTSEPHQAAPRRWTSGDWRQLGFMAACIVALHVIGFSLLASATSGATHKATISFGTGLLAYSLGMRHAFDVDHIAAIDGTTRKLLHEGKRPLSVGFFFSLGHSSVVAGLTLALGLGARTLGTSLDAGSAFRTWMTTVGTLISGVFLLILAVMNVVVLRSMIREARGVHRGEATFEDFQSQLQQRGFFARLTSSMTATITHPRQMFTVGLLFGLGFDTASEIGLLVLAGAVVVGGLPLYAVMALPIVFAAGMSLFDTLDGCFMHVAYAWALDRPAKAMFYNVAITGLSIAVAVVVALVEFTNLAAERFHLHGGIFDAVGSLSSSQAGLVVVGSFAAVFASAIVVRKLISRVERDG